MPPSLFRSYVSTYFPSPRCAPKAPAKATKSEKPTCPLPSKSGRSGARPPAARHRGPEISSPAAFTPGIVPRCTSQISVSENKAVVRKRTVPINPAFTVADPLNDETPIRIDVVSCCTMAWAFGKRLAGIEAFVDHLGGLVSPGARKCRWHSEYPRRKSVRIPPGRERHPERRRPGRLRSSSRSRPKRKDAGLRGRRPRGN